MKMKIILLHGLRGDHHGLQEVAEMLEKKGFDVVNPDLPGYGKADSLSKKTLDSYSKWIDGLVDAQKEKPFIVAHSMGSIIASHYLATHPDKTQSKAVFISPIFRSDFKQKSSNVRCALTNAAPHLLPPRPRLGLMRSKLASFCISHYLTSDKKQSKKIDEMHYKYSGNVNSGNGLLEDIKISMKEQTVPVNKMDILYIMGEKDRLTPAKLAKERATKNGANYIEVAGVGHLINYENPEAVVKAISDYLL